MSQGHPGPSQTCPTQLITSFLWGSPGEISRPTHPHYTGGKLRPREGDGQQICLTAAVCGLDEPRPVPRS